MKKHKYPAFAPAGLVQHQIGLIDIVTSQGKAWFDDYYLLIAEMLLTDKKMQRAWKALEKAAEKSKNQIWDIEFAQKVAFFSIPPRHERLTRKQVATLAAEAKQAADTLVGILAVFRFDVDLTAKLIALSENSERIFVERKILSRPKEQRSQLHYFVRKMIEYLNMRYGRPMTGVVATVADIVFLERLDDREIRRFAKTGHFPPEKR